MERDVFIENSLSKLGCKEIKEYCLISNHGYMFMMDNVNYDLRHWVNCYGAECDYWNVSPSNAVLDDLAKKLNRGEY